MKLIDLISKERQTSNPTGQALLVEASEAVRNILSEENSCSRFFGRSALEAFEAMIAVAIFGQLPSARVGIRQRIPLAQYHPNTLPQFRTIENIGPPPTLRTSDGSHISPFVVPTSFIINTNSFFFPNSGAPPLRGFQPGSLGARVLALLHELGHIIYAPTSSLHSNPSLAARGFLIRDFLLPPDQNDNVQNNANTDQVLQNCARDILMEILRGTDPPMPSDPSTAD